MPSEPDRKFPLPVILLVIAALVVSAVVSFYLGRMDGERQTQPPVVAALLATARRPVSTDSVL